MIFILFYLHKIYFLFLRPNLKGAIAQLVERRTENPCVAGSTPAGTTTIKQARKHTATGFLIEADMCLFIYFLTFTPL